MPLLQDSQINFSLVSVCVLFTRFSFFCAMCGNFMNIYIYICLYVCTYICILYMPTYIMQVSAPASFVLKIIKNSELETKSFCQSWPGSHVCCRFCALTHRPAVFPLLLFISLRIFGRFVCKIWVSPFPCANYWAHFAGFLYAHVCAIVSLCVYVSLCVCVCVCGVVPKSMLCKWKTAVS